jgi:hypothetical protein
MKGPIRLVAWLALFAVAPAARAERSAEHAIPTPSPELLVGPSRAERPPNMHPAVVLRDKAGQSVAGVGGLVSFTSSCGTCHDATWIGQHGYHFRVGVDEQTSLGRAPSRRAWDFGSGLFGRWDPLLGYDSVIRPNQDDAAAVDRWILENRHRLAGGGPAQLGDMARDYEPNCALCHIRHASVSRVRQLPLGAYQTAALEPLGLVEVSTGANGVARATWKSRTFLPDGSVDGTQLTIERPSTAACGFCHAIAVGKDPELAAFGPAAGFSETTGQIFVPTRISDGSLNVAGRTSLTRPWDVHAERLLSCSNCHFSPNDPRSAFRSSVAQPEHLSHEVRGLPLGQFLRRPSHEFAKGFSTQGPVANALDGTMRRCEDCHDARRVHRWLPQVERHLEVVGCETCHVDTVHAPARRVTDYSVIDVEGQPRVEYRGIRGSIIDPAAYLPGYQPVWLQRKDAAQRRRLLPYNVVTSFYWVVDDAIGPRPASVALLKRALYETEGAPARLRDLLDRNHDGQIEQEERWLSTEIEVETVKTMLVAAGAQHPRIVGELQPYGVHHGMAPARFALRRCDACHSSQSRLLVGFQLADRSPFGVTPTMIGDSNLVPTFAVERGSHGQLLLVPNVAAMGLHVFGLSRSRSVDAIGLAALGLILAGLLGHGSIRIWSSQKRRRRSS